MVRILPLLCLLWIAGYTESANILYVIPFTAKSHYFFLRPIGLELARRGHNVTVITPFKETAHPPSYTEVMVEKKGIWELSGGGERPNVFSMLNMSAFEFHDLLHWKGGPAFTEHSLRSSEVQEFLAKDSTFDVVIASQFYLEAWYMLAHRYQAPLIIVATFGNCMRHNILLGNPLQQATVVSEFIKIENPSSFWGRLKNFGFSAFEIVYFKYWYLNKQEEIAKKYIPKLPKPVPSLYEIQRNVSLTLYNSHFSFDPPTAYLPNIVEIGGLHLTERKSDIPKDLQDILDDATKGIVYMSFGTNVQSSELPDDKRDAFLDVFKKLEQTVLWKWEDDKLKNLPKNVVIRKWFPQKEILSHPNIKVFISHGGMIGTQEAVFHGVPIIGVPVFSDQYNNLLQVQSLGMGKLLEFKDINKETLEKTLLEVLNNDSYGNIAKEVSRRFKDRPMSALDTAMFWIEYVIRNKGADFMKNPARNLHWIESSMIDVYAFVLIVAVLILLVLVGLIRVFVLIFTGSQEVNYRTKQKKN